MKKISHILRNLVFGPVSEAGDELFWLAKGLQELYAERKSGETDVSGP